MQQENTYLSQFPDIIKQLRQLSNLNNAQILFDSRLENWRKNESIFNEKIIGRNNIFILIHDMEGNIFGGYIKTKINKECEWIKDEEAFIFSLESNGRIMTPKSFPIKKDKSQYAILLFSKDFDYLFQIGFGYDIVVTKQNHSNNFLSGVNETSFEYGKLKYPLCGSKTFIVSRIIAIEMN
ncbi:hypothetical protein ENU1_023160 [Entamoeba nuttalli P19]|uniref:TLDc domain-containing protein n=1 Tax=Entamoeba nuttalli (strain P19) TaxID=1076696 RepID=K2GHZ0_ENTNP|nr:hypothetical protein ENU1_023160 [Entamoeba nuttalli P19]EKE42376.1 hypothetical protein ENU1_023160 [Entamoeba nuttalli P19]|eukprot:XP_008855292.1 hypothetical protein ENU1_023160 [Entamoeba nuttalli P19]